MSRERCLGLGCWLAVLGCRVNELETIYGDEVLKPAGCKHYSCVVSKQAGKQALVEGQSEEVMVEDQGEFRLVRFDDYQKPTDSGANARYVAQSGAIFSRRGSDGGVLPTGQNVYLDEGWLLEIGYCRKVKRGMP